MANKILLVFLAFDFLFLCCGLLILALVILTRAAITQPQTLSNVAQNVLLDNCPLIAAGVNAIFIFATFLLSLPAIIAHAHRLFLKIHGYMVVFCALFTMIVGLLIWFETLKTRSNLAGVWGHQTSQVQSLLQQKFQCCGYTNAQTPPFIKDDTCTNTLVANSLQGCVTPFSNFTNNYLDLVFTAVFGVAALDVLLLLSVACLVKDRKERERFRLIDQKSDFAPI